MPDHGETTDIELVFLVQERDHSAFTEIYNRYWKVLFIHALKILKDENEAADVIQDLFTVIWTQSEQWHIESNLKAYLYTGVRNRCLKAIAKGNRREAFVDELTSLFKEGTNATVNELDSRELEYRLQQEIEKLPPRMQEVYIKSREQGLSHKQIADEMGIAENSVKTTMHRTLTSLRTKLSPFLSLFFF
ncbi:RNA polymerase sigma factor [Chitinophaga sp. S165]|uniref:RNA polymerase sigma factor n=1 Tax=Chitinophaga sp. S165 TaxID=2135462 RepID=UPI000D70FDB0|nr:RNA polymerase sigma-70 factor [Chitinophaga sp. S165]PWV46537.1 RNA polymerase sigma-70 factor (ECF subfamily) [Chitinophaga sp. S165]